MPTIPDWRNDHNRIRDIPAEVIYAASPGVKGGDPKSAITLPCVTKVEYPASRDPARTFEGLPRRQHGMRGDAG
jgi:hypothetical protein